MTVEAYHRKLARVLDRMGGLYVLNDILTAIAEGRMQSFVEGDSWAVTQVSRYPRQLVLDIVAVVGDLPELRILHDRLVVYAAEVGAGVIWAYGRKGWLPDARRRGWKVKARNYIYVRES